MKQCWRRTALCRTALPGSDAARAAKKGETRLEIIVLVLFLTVVMPRLKDMSLPKKFTDSGAKFYAPSLNANGAVQARPRAAGRRRAGKAASGGAVGVGCAALCVLFACVGLNQLAENAFFVYSLGSAVTLAADVAQYGLLSLAFGKLSKLGFRLFERVKHFRLYRDIINLQEACPLADIARASGRSAAAVEKDLKELVRRGYFPFGFVDDETGCFLGQQRGVAAEKPQRAKEQDERARAKPRRRKKKSAGGARCAAAQSAFAAQGESFLRELDTQIKEIDDEEIAQSARGIREKAQDIFEWVRSHPDAQDDVRRFCDYYMPTTLRLLQVYNEVEPHTASSEAAASVRTEVRGVLAPVNDAFANLLDSLFAGRRAGRERRGGRPEGRVVAGGPCGRQPCRTCGAQD